MARMYPDHLDERTQSKAERALYEALREQLDESYVVFHHVGWLAHDKRKHPQDGEADFVIAHADRGVLVIEVKGGTIRRDSKTGYWTTTSASGVTEVIADPVEQAKDSKYVLLDRLKLALSRYIVIGHAVAFPDVAVKSTFLGLTLPRQIVLDATDVPQLTRWVERALDYWDGRYSGQETPLGQSGLAKLISILGNQWEIRPALWRQFDEEGRQLMQLTEQQYAILDALNRQRRVVISGFAGSGKTLLAVEKAVRLSRQGFRTLLVCYNSNLATDLRGRLVDVAPLWTGLDVDTFHNLCFRLAREYGVSIPKGTNDEEYFASVLPTVLPDVARRASARYDAIIVDEAQDFDPRWWQPLQTLLRDRENGIWYLFFDDNQRLYDRPLQLPIDVPPYQLTINCRTTRRIHDQVLRFYRQSEDGLAPVAHGPEGRPVERLTYDDKQETLQQAVISLLQHLIEEEHVPASEIAVLTPFSHRKSLLKAESLRPTQDITLHWSAQADGTKQVRLDTIHSFKGLERPVVILTEIERWSAQGMNALNRERLLYVACSRAKHYLIVLLPRHVSVQVSRLFGS
jgi:Nuclease-related domain/UvrD-like helicase C-terminal domain/AAA domain